MSDQTQRPTLLPANASPLERGLDLGFGALLDRIAPPFPELMDPTQTPVAFLPYLAADRGVSEWSPQANEAEKRLTISLSWQIQRQAGTGQALSHAVESLGFTPNVTAWHQQRPTGVPYTFDVQAIVGRDWSSGDHNRLIQRINAAKSERDGATITIVHATAGGLRTAAGADPGLSVSEDSRPATLPDVPLAAFLVSSGAAWAPLSDAELRLGATLPTLVLGANLAGAGATRRYTINDYDLKAQP
ncbi:phage tail protein I [Pseudomonas sp. COR58]|uniref:Phage tail protein I n=1 Tax=Pseudomonas ekonensis TaxID=2842353 RepID=A0ABS6PHR0_9PSED|nr:phage tail protein I [Pseudomonas ekonensis]MBV4460019.1 phage tail protein I [Pseudomonas ekonensis]